MLRKEREFRADICRKISEIHDKHCNNCEDPNRLRGNKEHTNRNIKYCVKECEHGKKIRNYGIMLERK